MPHIILLDGHSYIYRYHHKLSHLSTSKGHPTGALFGFCLMLKQLIQKYPSTPVIVFLDAGGKNFRHELYPEYKSNRLERPADIQQQMPLIRTCINMMGIPLIEELGFEADDMIGTIAKHYAQNLKVMISSADKDFCQLVGGNIFLERAPEDEVFDTQAVFNAYGLYPEQFVDYLALLGDSSDNIPGVPKVGKVTATKWLSQYGSLENLIEHRQELTGAVGQSFRDHIADARLSKQLATINCDCPWPKQLNQQTVLPPIPHPDLASLQAIYQEYELYSLLPQGKPLALQAPNYLTQVVEDEETFEQMVEFFLAAKKIAIDIETTSLSVFDAELIAVSLCSCLSTSWVILFYKLSLDLQARFFGWLKEGFHNHEIDWIAHNWKFDGAHIFERIKTLPSHYQDTMLLSYVYAAHQSHDLKSLARVHLNWTLTPYEEIVKKGQTLRDCPEKVLVNYSGADAMASYRLFLHFDALLDESPELKKVYNQIDKPLVFLLMQMERDGILLDANRLKELDLFLEAQIKKLSEAIYEQSQERFNINSTKQLRAILFEKLCLPSSKKTATGVFSTNEDALFELIPVHPIAQLLLDYRRLEKLRSTYTQALVQQINPKTHRVHTTYHQAGTITGRLSSSDPNLQNIPIKDREGVLIREAFRAQEGWVILCADYSQIELRLMAHYSQDRSLLEAYKDNQDIHAQTASTIFSIPLGDVTQDHRRIAKTVNFGLIYGMTAWGLSRQLKINHHDAQKMIETYFNRYPLVLHYMDKMKEFAIEHGYVKTLNGRSIPIARSLKGNLSQGEIRSAINGPLQGTASDLMKQAMVLLKDKLFKNRDQARLLLQVHDELVFEIKKEYLTVWKQIIQESMEQAESLSVPLIVQIGIGPSWGEAK